MTFIYNGAVSLVPGIVLAGIPAQYTTIYVSPSVTIACNRRAQMHVLLGGNTFSEKLDFCLKQGFSVVSKV